MPQQQDKLTLIQAFGKVIRLRRTRKGLSQEKFSFEAGFDRTYVSGIERGRRNPTLTTIQRLAEALGTEPSSLLRAAQRLTE